MKAKVPLIVIVIVIAVTASYFTWREHKTTGDTRVKSSGTVEVTETQIAPQISGRLAFFRIEEGTAVRSGDLVARLSIDDLEAQERANIAALAQAQEMLKELEAGTRPEQIAQAAAQLRAKEANLSQARRDASRFAKLLNEGVVSVRESEVYNENATVAAADVAAQKEQLRLLKKGPRTEEIAQQREVVAQAKARLDATRLNISYKEVYAPVSGMVLTKNFEEGEVVSAGTPLFTIGSTADTWIKIYIPSTQLGEIRVGQRAQIFVDSYPNEPFHGHIKSISQNAEFNPRLSLTQSERANQVFWVKVAVSDDKGVMKPGMPADVVLEAITPE